MEHLSTGSGAERGVDVAIVSLRVQKNDSIARVISPVVLRRDRSSGWQATQETLAGKFLYSDTKALMWRSTALNEQDHNVSHEMWPSFVLVADIRLSKRVET